jgi:hypothetical protein
VKSGKKTISAGALKPHELVEEAMQFTGRCASGTTSPAETCCCRTIELRIASV